MKKEYSNGEVTVVWQPDKCIHSKNCFKGLPAVFNPDQRPWVNVDASDTETIVNQIKKCPSGALSYKIEGEEPSSTTTEPTAAFKVNVVEGGPLMVHGDIEVIHKDGKIEKREKVTAFCRCGASANKPFCDGKHKNISFDL